MTDDVVTLGLRTISSIRDHGHTFEGWAEPGRESLGRYNTYSAAARAIYDNDIKARQHQAGEVHT